LRRSWSPAGSPGSRPPATAARRTPAGDEPPTRRGCRPRPRAITFDDGGTVTIVLEGPQTFFEASERFGVTSYQYPDFPGSFSIASVD
jgi:hypothetical protein